MQQFLDRGIVTPGNTRFELVPAGAETGAPHQMGHQCDVACMCHGRILPLLVVSRGQTANAVRRLCLTRAIVMGFAWERGCRRRGRSPSPRGNARTELRLESADRHRAGPTVPSRESRSKRHRPAIAATEQPLPRRYGRKPGIAVFIGRHIFNRSFRNDVNAGVMRTD